MRTLEHEVNEVAKDRLAKVEALQEVRDGMALAATLASNAVITPEASARESEKRRILTLRAETQQKLAALDKKFVIPRSRELLQQIASTRASYNEMIDRVLELAERGDSVAAGRLLLGSVRERQEVLFRALDESIALQREQANGLASKAASDAAFGAGLLVVLALVMISLAAGLAWGIVRNLTRAFGAEPEEVNAAVNRVARGELTQDRRNHQRDRRHRISDQHPRAQRGGGGGARGRAGPRLCGGGVGSAQPRAAQRGGRARDQGADHQQR
jgi:methyl-accepting chemotaxis protein